MFSVSSDVQIITIDKVLLYLVYFVIYNMVSLAFAYELSVDRHEYC